MRDVWRGKQYFYTLCYSGSNSLQTDAHNSVHGVSWAHNSTITTITNKQTKINHNKVIHNQGSTLQYLKMYFTWHLEHACTSWMAALSKLFSTWVSKLPHYALLSLDGCVLRGILLHKHAAQNSYGLIFDIYYQIHFPTMPKQIFTVLESLNKPQTKTK